MAWGAPAWAAPITLTYQATIETVAGTPFGLTTSAQGQVVSGSFRYETTTPDSNVTATRGNYNHAAGGAFLANLPGGLTITGSSTPRVEVENLNPDTFRFIDGVVNLQGTMAVNAVPSATARLNIAITDNSGAVFANDLIPNPFPLGHSGGGAYPWPHTFALAESSGTLLLQFVSVVPEPSSAAIGLLAAPLLLSRRRRAVRR